MSNNEVRVQIRYNDIKQSIEGSVEETWLLLCKFYGEFIPSFDLAKNLWISVDIQALAKDCEGLIGFSLEGSNMLVPKTKLTDNETLSLWLLASYLGKRLNLLGSDALSKEELTEKLGKSGKITGTRLGELVKNNWATKTMDEKFLMTSFGVVQMQKEVLPE